MFGARTGVLRTKTHRAKFADTDTWCAICQNEEETIEHLVINCTGLCATFAEGMRTNLAGALTFVGGSGRIEEKIITITKRRFEDWWKRSREVCYVTKLWG